MGISSCFENVTQMLSPSMHTKAFWENPCEDSSLGIRKGTLGWKKLMKELEVRDPGHPVNVQRKRNREHDDEQGKSCEKETEQCE